MNSCFPPIHNHLGTIFVSSVGLEDIIAPTEALSKFFKQILNDSQQSLSLTEHCNVFNDKRCLPK